MLDARPAAHSDYCRWIVLSQRAKYPLPTIETALIVPHNLADLEDCMLYDAAPDQGRIGCFLTHPSSGVTAVSSVRSATSECDPFW